MTSLSALTGGVPLSARRDPGPNVAPAERWVSAVGGGILAAIGVKRGGLVGVAAGLVGAGLIARGVSGHSVAKRVLTPTDTEKHLAESQGWKHAAPIGRAVSIGKPRQEVYAFFRDLKNLTSFMENIERIDVIDDKRSHWVVKAPAGKTVEWDSVITEDLPGQRIAYGSQQGADIRSVGVVEFRDGPVGRGTEVHVTIVFEPPHGKLGRIYAAMFLKDPAIQLRQDLVRMKMIMETGEVATSKAPDASPRA